MLHLFDAVGIELEYMIVDAELLTVRPVCDQLLKAVSGHVGSEWENGPIAWSNELVMHVVEFKTNGPARSWKGLADGFHRNILLANNQLKQLNCKLLPTACHPFMDPFAETVIWPYDCHEIYELYDRIFGCKGHGWSNLQSMHINLPFANDDEFGRLHCAIRLLMPVMPALFASSPLLEGQATGFADSRMEAYRHNQEKIPSIAGMVVPEMVLTKADYEKKVFAPIIRDIRPYDTHGVLDKHFLNSRGCIARFDRAAIEIRVLDLQESPLVDLALAQFLVEALKLLVEGHWATFAQQQRATTEMLHHQLLSCIRSGSHTVLEPDYLKLFGVLHPVSAHDFWRYLFWGVARNLPNDAADVVKQVIELGCLSTRISKAIGENYTAQKLVEVYHRLAGCLAENKLFVP